jgi:hypothetical protein
MKALWQRFMAWLDREVELLDQHTWDPLTSQDPKVQRTIARQQDAAERMRFEGIPLLHVSGRKNWRQPFVPRAKPTIVLPFRGRK